VQKQIIKDGLLWGFFLWLVGYVIGILLFMLVPTNQIGWIITPIGILITLFVLFKKMKGNSIQYYLKVAFIWTIISVVFDYLLIVKMFKPADGYYKTDVYFCYLSTFTLPLLVGYYKLSKHNGKKQ
jgi:hypothetical protein